MSWRQFTDDAIEWVSAVMSLAFTGLFAVALWQQRYWEALIFFGIGTAHMRTKHRMD